MHGKYCQIQPDSNPLEFLINLQNILSSLCSLKTQDRKYLYINFYTLQRKIHVQKSIGHLKCAQKHLGL